MLIQKFKNKLTLRLQDQLNSSMKLSNTISVLAKYCLSVYKQMLATNQIKKKTTFVLKYKL